MNKMKILLIEDDSYDCEQFKSYVADHKHISLQIMNGTKMALRYLSKNVADIILLDLEFNNSDGGGIEFLQKLSSLKLKVKPFIIVTTNNLSKIIHELARKNGADYIFTKSKIDYSPQAVIELATLYFSTKNDIVLSQCDEMDEDAYKRRIAKIMENIGITNNMMGKGYLIDAVYMVMTSSNPIDVKLSRDIYPSIAKKYKKSDQCVEKAIGNAIKRAWRITDIDALTRFYTAEISYLNGFPTNKEFIFYVADKVK